MSEPDRHELDTETLRHVGAPLRKIDQVMEIVGIALLPIGLTAILLGWYGAAKTGWVFEQIPYLISGGLIGLGLMFAAGSLYLASWISRSSAWNRHQTSLLLEALDELKHVRGVGSAASPFAPAGSVNGAAMGKLVATPRGSMFHLPDCPVVAGRDDLREVAPDADGMKPCGMCAPLEVDRPVAH
jgi:hypothetical protein